jgi:putative transposase
MAPWGKRAVDERYVHWPHRPAHLFRSGSVYSVTAGTLYKCPYFNTDAKKDCVLNAIFTQARHFAWQLEAWAVLHNHYHVVAVAPEDADMLSAWMMATHSLIARGVNQLDRVQGRPVMYQYWDTCITTVRSYYARLKYVHENPVKHGLVQNASQYRWCSMAWFLSNPDAPHIDEIIAAKTDRVTIYDDF